MESSEKAWVAAVGVMLAVAVAVGPGAFKAGLIKAESDGADRAFSLREQIEEVRRGKHVAEANLERAESARQALKAQVDSLTALNASLELRAGTADLVRYVATENAKLEAQIAEAKQDKNWILPAAFNNPATRQRALERTAEIDADVLRLTQQMTSNMALLKKCD